MYLRFLLVIKGINNTLVDENQVNTRLVGIFR